MSISHIRQLFSLKDINEIKYYTEQVKKRNLSKRQLEEIIKNKEYERLPDKTKIKLINVDNASVIDLVKNPILIKNNQCIIEYCSDKRILSREYTFS